MSRAETGRLSVASALVRASFLVNAVYTETAREYGITAQQGQLMCVLMGCPRGMSDLGETLGLAKSSLTGLVDRTSQRGLVCREPDPEDRRAVRVALTAEGAPLVEAFHAETCRRVEHLAAGLPAADRDALVALLTEVVTANDVPVVFQGGDEGS